MIIACFLDSSTHFARFSACAENSITPAMYSYLRSAGIVPGLSISNTIIFVMDKSTVRNRFSSITT